MACELIANVVAAQADRDPAIVLVAAHVVDNSQEDALDNADAERECCICMDASANTCFAPCGHSVACGACADFFLGKRCPVCREVVQDYNTGHFEKAYMADRRASFLSECSHRPCEAWAPARALVNRHPGADIRPATRQFHYRYDFDFNFGPFEIETTKVADVTFHTDDTATLECYKRGWNENGGGTIAIRCTILKENSKQLHLQVTSVVRNTFVGGCWRKYQVGQVLKGSFCWISGSRKLKLPNFPTLTER
jgi:hypothetical protein